MAFERHKWALPQGQAEFVDKIEISLVAPRRNRDVTHPAYTAGIPELLPEKYKYMMLTLI